MSQGLNLAGEVFASYGCWFKHPVRDHMVRLGVADAARLAAGNVGMLEIDPLAGGLYQPAPGSGRWALVLPIYGAVQPPCVQPADPQPIDLVVWLANRPDRWWLRRGVAALLGEWTMELAEVYDRPLLVHRTPLEWLRAGGDGVVVLDHEAAWFALRGLRIVAQDALHAAELDSRLRPPTSDGPHILLRTEAA